MPRSLLFGLLVTWILVATFILNSFVAYDSELGLTVSGTISDFTGDADAGFITNSFSLLRTLWGALTWQISGLPAIFSLLWQIPTFIIGFMILQFVRGN